MAKPKYPQETMDLAEVMCRQTSLTAEECARLMRLPRKTLLNWWAKIEPFPAHRRRCQGTKPEDPTAALERRVKELEGELVTKNVVAQEVTGESPKDTKSLIDLARLRLQEQLGVRSLAKMGEVAAALRVLVEVRKEEIDAAIQDRCKVIYYLPGGTCPSCGAKQEKIRPEDLIGDNMPDLSRPN